MEKQLTSNYKLSQKACATLSSLHSTLTLLADTSMSTEHSTALSSGSTGLECTLISRKCAGHVQVAPSQTAPNGNLLSSSSHSFPIKAPFRVLHIDGYYAGQFKGFEGSELYLVACCGMCTFAVIESVDKPDSTAFASAIMKMQLRFGFSHTIVLDKDSKFFGQVK